jgi:hypothetical protein
LSSVENIGHYIFFVEINMQTNIFKRNLKIHFEFRTSLRNFLDLNFRGATGIKCVPEMVRFWGPHLFLRRSSHRLLNHSISHRGAGLGG